jgi:hypothetical protein
MSCYFDVSWSDLSLWLQIELIDDDDKLTCYSPQSSSRATALPAMLEEADARIEERRRLVSRNRLGTIE